jgi:hypothetical protein
MHRSCHRRSIPDLRTVHVPLKNKIASRCPLGFVLWMSYFWRLNTFCVEETGPPRPSFQIKALLLFKIWGWHSLRKLGSVVLEVGARKWSCLLCSDHIRDCAFSPGSLQSWALPLVVQLFMPVGGTWEICAGRQFAVVTWARSLGGSLLAVLVDFPCDLRNSLPRAQGWAGPPGCHREAGLQNLMYRRPPCKVKTTSSCWIHSGLHHCLTLLPPFSLCSQCCSSSLSHSAILNQQPFLLGVAEAEFIAFFIQVTCSNYSWSTY